MPTTPSNRKMWCKAILWFLALLCTHALTLFGQAPTLVVQRGHNSSNCVASRFGCFIDAIAFSHNGRWIASAGDDSTIRLWDVDTGLEVRTYNGTSLGLGFSGIRSLAFDPQDRLLAATSQYAESVVTFSLETGQNVSKYDLSGPEALQKLGLKEKQRPGFHPCCLDYVMFSPDGAKILAAAPFSGYAFIWETATGRISSAFRTGVSDLSIAAFSVDGNLLAIVAGQYSHTRIEIWSTATGKFVRQLPGGAEDTSALVFTLDSQFLISAGEDGTVTKWRKADGSPVWSVHLGESIAGLAVSFDGAEIACAAGDFVKTARPPASDRLYILDARSGTGIQSIATAHKHDPTMKHAVKLAFSQDGRFLGSAEDVVKLWTCPDFALTHTLSDRVSAALAAAVAPDGRWIAIAGGDGNIRLWETATGEQHDVIHSTGISVSRLIFNRDSQTLAAVIVPPDPASAQIMSWHFLSGDQLGTIPIGQYGALIGFGVDGNSVIAMGSFPQDISSYELTGQRLRMLIPSPYTAGAVPHSVQMSPDGRYLVRSSGSGLGRQLTIYDLKTEALRIVRSGNPKVNYFAITAMAISPDSRVVAVEGADAPLEMWTLGIGTAIGSCALEKYPTSMAFSPDGKSLAVAETDNKIEICDVTSRRISFSLRGHEDVITALAFTPEGLLLSTSLDQTTRLWDIRTGKPLAVLLSSRNFDGWLVVDPEGRFDTNDLDGVAPLAWVVPDDPMRALPPEIFMRDYYTPGLLATIMKGQQDKLPKLPSIAEIQNRVQPDVSVMRVTPATEPGRVDVTVHAASHLDQEKRQESGLQDLRLFRDGQLVGSGYVDVTAACAGAGTQSGRVHGGYIQGALKDCDYTFHDVQLKSNEKKVTFTAYAFNSQHIKSATASLDYEPTAAAAIPLHPKAYLLQIGVNHYAASRCELNYSVADAEKMSAELAERLKARGYDVQAVKLESPEGGDVLAAGKQAIRTQLATIAAQATPDDVFFMSFSGHGYTDSAEKGGEFYILPSDIQGSCRVVDQTLLNSAISADELADWLRPIDAGEMTLILDACFSAESVQSGEFKPGPLGSRGLGQLAYDKRMRILAASQSDEVAHEYDSLNNGLLTYVLTHDGLDERKAAWKAPYDRITVGEWLAYAANAVPKFVLPKQSKASAPANVVSKFIPLDQSSTSGSKAAGSRFEDRSATGTIQIPALFDFSKQDSVVLQ